MKAAAFDYHDAASLGDAIAALARSAGGARPLAGGGSLGPMLNLRLARPSALVDVRRLPELRGLARTADGLEIGAAWTHAEIEDGIVPDVTHGLMRKVAAGIAYRPIRNRGTLGGSLAHADPAADWVTTMAALDATLVIAGPAGSRREAATSFMRGAYTTSLADAEIVQAVAVPVLSPGARWAYEKVARKTGEFALAIGAVVIDPARNYARVVCGAVEAPPLVLAETSHALARSVDAALGQASGEIETLLAAQPPAFRQIHVAAVVRALARLAS